MENRPDSSMNLSEVMRMAQSPAGQQLLALLRKSSGEELRAAMERASTGDYSQAKKTISDFLSTPEAKALMDQLRR